MIHICFALHDKTGRYSKFTGTTMLSLFDNTNSEVTVHILHDNTLSFDNREKFIYLAGRYNQHVKFYNVEQLCADKIAEIKNSIPRVLNSGFTIATFYRFLIPYIFSSEIDKVIYLDSDLIVNLDIAELWRIELDGRPIAGVSEHMLGSDPRWFVMCRDGLVKLEDYFNAGVIVMDLNVFRAEEQRLLNGIKFIAANPQYNFFDQDVLNYCFSTTALKLPTKFNVLVRDLRIKPNQRIERKIYHYAAAGTQLNSNDIFNRLWLKYFLKTPFFDEDTIGRLYASFQQIHVQLKRSMMNISATVSGKTRVFFDAAANVNAIKQMFSLRKGEEVITPENGGIQRLLDAMKKSRGKKVFFIMPPNFPYQVLIEAGFEFGKDFVNGLEFLSEEQGLPLNSNAMINAM